MAIGSHQSAKMKNDEWITPKWIIDGLGTKFDLDPCAPVSPPWKIANTHYYKPLEMLEKDGLNKEWFGKVWLNPPYSREIDKWMKKMVIHNNGIALTFARTETKMFFNYVWPVATGILFIEGRLYFHYVDGSRAKANSGGPSVLVSYGKENAEILKNSNIDGKFLYIN
ncbi:MAG: DNA N-6-adenine-methyltransferase [archaeon]